MRHGVGRIVYASSNHAVGFTPREPMLPVGTPARPDSFYGLGKVAGEALCSLYHDRHGIAVACLRIGSFRERPTTRRHLSTWLSHGDAVRLVDACLRLAGPRVRGRLRDLGQHAGVVGPGAGPRHRVPTRRTTPRRGRPRSRPCRRPRRTSSTRRYVGGEFTR